MHLGRVYVVCLCVCVQCVCLSVCLSVFVCLSEAPYKCGMCGIALFVILRTFSHYLTLSALFCTFNQFPQLLTWGVLVKKFSAYNRGPRSKEVDQILISIYRQSSSHRFWRANHILKLSVISALPQKMLT